LNIEELEKEAGDYADKHAFRVPYDGSNKFYDDVDNCGMDCVDRFKQAHGIEF
jgi:hypothetical protein